MSFTYKTDAQLEAMTSAERDQYAVDKRNHEADQLAEAIKGEMAKAITKDEFKAIETKLSELEKTSKENETLNAQVKELKEDLRVMKDNTATFSATNETDLFAAIEKGLAEFLPKVKETKKNHVGEKDWEIEMVVKAPVNMATTAITSSTTIPVNYVYQQVTEYMTDPRARTYILPYLSNGNTNRASLPYGDKIPTEGTMGITAEGALKPLISVAFVLRWSQAKKMAGRTKISEEALDDIPYIMSIIRNELVYQHDISVQADVFSFVNSYAANFVPGSLAASTTSPTNYDVLRVAAYAVKIQSKGTFIPNAAVVPSSDIYAMGATKDANNNYVMPPFVLPDGTRVENMAIVEDPYGVVPPGNYIVGDWKQIHRDLYKAFSIRIGQGILGSTTAGNIVSDFEANMYTLIGESRYHLYGYENAKVAFVKGTFAGTKTAIAAS